jgi:hypothetical protein
MTHSSPTAEQATSSPTRGRCIAVVRGSAAEREAQEQAVQAWAARRRYAYAGAVPVEERSEAYSALVREVERQRCDAVVSAIGQWITGTGDHLLKHQLGKCGSRLIYGK